MKCENTPALPPGRMGREEERCLGVGEELVLDHEDIQQCLTNGIITHTYTLRLLEEEIKWENTQALPPGWICRREVMSLVLG